MAKPKKSAPKKSASNGPAKKPPAKKPAKKPAAVAPKKRASARSTSVALSSADRQSKLKPPDGYDDLVTHVVNAWKTHSRAVRIDGRSAAKLESSKKKAMRARDKEDALREKLEDKLRPLTDARILAEETMWSQVLDVYRVVKAMTPMRPELEDAFRELTDQFARGPMKKDGDVVPEVVGAGG